MTKNPTTARMCQDPSENRGCVLKFLLGIFLFGLLSIAIFAFFQPFSWYQRISIFGVGFFIAITFFLSGITIGFVFGRPKITAPAFDNQLKSQPDEVILITENNNFEQVFDWLTKIIIGVGLTQLTQIPGALQQFSIFIEPAFGGSPYGGVLGTFILISYSFDGFLISFVYTRTRYWREQDIAFTIKRQKELIEQH